MNNPAFGGACLLCGCFVGRWISATRSPCFLSSAFVVLSGASQRHQADRQKIQIKTYFGSLANKEDRLSASRSHSRIPLSLSLLVPARILAGFLMTSVFIMVFLFCVIWPPVSRRLMVIGCVFFFIRSSVSRGLMVIGCVLFFI